MKKLMVCSMVIGVLLLMGAMVQPAQALEEVVKTQTVATVFKFEQMVRVTENVVILFDTSGSMDDKYHDTGMTKLQAAKKVLLERAKLFPDVFPELKVGLYTYTPPLSFIPNFKGYEVFYKMQPFNKAEFIKAVESLPEEGSGPTLLKNALTELDKLLATLSGRTVVILFTDGTYSTSGGDKKPVELARELAQKYDVSFHVVSTTSDENNMALLKAVTSINSSSKLYPIETLVDFPETYTGAIFAMEESYIVSAQDRKQVVGLKLDHILFDHDGALVKPEFNKELDAAGKVLKDNPKSYIVLAGFADNSGSKDYNMALSRKRVEMVADYLAKTFQIEMNRMLLLWYGEAAPIADNGTEEGRQKNRRVLGFISGLN
jgi:OOP family OmpA-OmpF porin